MARKRRHASGTKSRRSRNRGVRRVSRQGIDVDSVVEALVDEFASRSGLDILGLSREDYVEILKPIVAGIIDQYSSRPSKEAIMSKIRAAIQGVYMLASAYMLEKDVPLTRERLEFIVTNAPQVAARYVSKLYKELKSNGLDYLIPLLRKAWESYGRPTPIACPYCGFRGLTPDFVCIVCGREVEEHEVKKAIDFNEKLREFVEFYSPNDVIEAIERGYVVVNEHVKPPSAQLQPNKPELVLHLSYEEKELLRRMLREKVRGSH